MKKLPYFTLFVFVCTLIPLSGARGIDWEAEVLDKIRGKEQLLLRDKRPNVKDAKKQEFKPGIYFVEISNEMSSGKAAKRNKKRRKGMPSVIGGSERPELYPGESIVREVEDPQEFISIVTLGIGKLTDMHHPGVSERKIAKRYAKSFKTNGYVESLLMVSYHKYKFMDQALLDKGQEPSKLEYPFKATVEFCIEPFCNVRAYLDVEKEDCEEDENGRLVCYNLDEGEEALEDVEEEGKLVMNAGSGVTNLPDVAFFSIVYEDWDGKKVRQSRSRRKK